MDIFDFIEGDLQNYLMLVTFIVAIFCVAVVVKFLRNKTEPYANIKLEKMQLGYKRISMDGRYVYIEKGRGVIHAIAIHQVGEGIPRVIDENDSLEPRTIKRDGLKRLFRTLSAKQAHVTAVTHIKGRIANTNIELVNDEVLDGRRVSFNPEPHYQVLPHFIVTQPFVYKNGHESDFKKFVKEFDVTNQEIKTAIKSAFPTLRLLPDDHRKVAFFPEYVLSQIYSAYLVDVVQTNPKDKKSTLNIGLFRRPLEANSSYLTKVQSTGFLELISGVTKRYQPAQFLIPAKTDNTVFLGYAVDTTTDMVTRREVGFDTQHLRQNLGVYGLDRIATVRRIIHELVKRRFRVILIDPMYSERPYRNESHYCDLPSHVLKLGVDFNFNPLDRMGGSTGDFIDGFLTILQKIYARADLSRWQFLTKKLKQLYEDSEREHGDEPTLGDLLRVLASEDEEENVDFGSPQLEELKQVIERILSDEKRINAIGTSTKPPLHMLFYTEGLTVIDLSTFTDRNFISFILQLMIFSMYTYQRYNQLNAQNTVLVIENAELIFPETTYLSTYRTRRMVESFHPLEHMRNTALVVSVQSPSDVPYLFSLPRTKIIHRVPKDTDLALICDTLGLRERGIDSRSPHPLQETYLRTMKHNHALLYLQRVGEQAGYVALKVEEVELRDTLIADSDPGREVVKRVPQSPTEKRDIKKRDFSIVSTMLEKDFPKDQKLYYEVLAALRDKGNRGVMYSAIPQMLSDESKEQVNHCVNILVSKLYLEWHEYTPRDSNKPDTYLKISKKGMEALNEYDELLASQSPDYAANEWRSPEGLEPIISSDEIQTSGKTHVFLVDQDNVREFDVETKEPSLQDKIEENIRDAHRTIEKHPDNATYAVTHCYDAIKLAFFQLLDMGKDPEVELDHIISALKINKINLPVAYSSLENIAEKHRLATTSKVLLDRKGIDAILGDTELIVKEIVNVKIPKITKKREQIIKDISAEKWGDGTETGSTPITKEVKETDHLIIIDGSNVAHKQSSHDPLAERVVQVLNALRNKGFNNLHVIVDASLIHKIKDIDVFNELKASGLLTEAPAEVEADEYIIKYAKKDGAYIITNDTYRDWREKDPWVKEHIADRRISFMFKNGSIKFGDLLDTLHTESESHTSIPRETPEELVTRLKAGASNEELAELLGVKVYKVEETLRSRFGLSETEFEERFDVTKTNTEDTIHPVITYTLKAEAEV